MAGHTKTTNRPTDVVRRLVRDLASDLVSFKLVLVVANSSLRERAKGFEPSTSSLGSWHSTAELRPRTFKKNITMIYFTLLSLGTQSIHAHTEVDPISWTIQNVIRGST